MASSSSSQPTHILVVGAGAVGCFYASRLHSPERGVLVSLVCRSNYPTIKAKGVHLKTRDFGEYHFTPHRAYGSIAEAAEDGKTLGGWQHVVVTTKALPDQVDDSASIAPLVSEGRTVVSLIQNGVGIEQPHRSRFPSNPVVSCVTVISAEQTSHGQITQNRWTRISLGPYTDGVGDDTSSSLAQRGKEATEQLCSWWSAGGIKDAEPHSEKELQLIRWHKLTINAAFNPSAVLSGGLGNALMVLDEAGELRRHIEGCMAEIFSVGPRVLNVERFPDHLARPEKIVKSTERNDKAAKPSMLLDWEAGRPMELEVILGNPVRIARERGLEMPRLQSMYALLKAAQAQRMARDKESKERARL
ncbi:2-dehydropantoate 2-reductase [Jaminaea rosea]|uniref:2-dehydropantoate 2-reductase n=1 Tax=Jaminaea rosea TaxID=1569628 RepID=A0A316UWJ2_9BASI|nr:2-dehydropantoate 2-reductase [Jaminaea rosea]PWN29344.1 2-dehydropantoate 2-reductase [Jaminaea rosea]